MRLWSRLHGDGFQEVAMRWMFVLLVCVPLWAHAAVPGLTVEPITVNVKRDTPGATEFSMPWVTSADRALASRINDQLYIGQFGALAPRSMTASRRDDRGLTVDGTVEQTFSVSRNDDRVLTFQFDLEGCGAYCESYTTFYSFDSRSGRRLALSDLFTRAGQGHLAEQLAKEQRRQYREVVASLKRELRAMKAPRSPDAISDLQTRIELNLGCLGDSAHTVRTPASPDASALMDALQYHRFELSAQSFKLTAGRCSNHAMRAADDVGDVTWSVPYAQLRAHMTAYGRALLLQEAPAAAPTSLYGQLLRGQLNAKTPITMLLTQYADRSVSGSYFYDKHGRGIELRGRELEGQLELTESAADGSASSATLRLNVSPKGLAGVWTDGSKQFDVRLAP